MEEAPGRAELQMETRNMQWDKAGLKLEFELDRLNQQCKWDVHFSKVEKRSWQIGESAVSLFSATTFVETNADCMRYNW